MAKISLDFSHIPGDVSLAMSQQQYTRELVDDLSRVMGLNPGDRELLHQEVVGAVAKVLDDYLVARPAPGR
jgi:hypothetical protein